jgi:hypothetical protein
MSGAPPAKRPRIEAIDEEEDVVESCMREGEAAASSSSSAATGLEVPPGVHADDYRHILLLAEAFKHDSDLRLLPLPKPVYSALGLQPPATVGLMESAINCLTRTSTRSYSGPIEVRDMRILSKPEDYPPLPTGLPHAHMLPEGGPVVINTTPAGAGSAMTDGEPEGEVYAHAAGAGAGAGAGAAACRLNGGFWTD